MKVQNFIILLASTLCVLPLAITGCDKDDDHHHMGDESDYHIHIHDPAPGSTFTVGETMPIEIEFEDHNGGIVHHINIRVFNATTQEEIYNQPLQAHVHTEESYLFQDALLLDVDPDTDWVLEAKVWGHEDGLGEISGSVAFQVEQ